MNLHKEADKVIVELGLISTKSKSEVKEKICDHFFTKKFNGTETEQDLFKLDELIKIICKKLGAK